MDLINKWTVLVLGIWLICGVVAVIRRRHEALGYALVTTVLIGMGYLLLHRP